MKPCIFETTNLPSSLVETKMMSQFFFADGAWRINLVSKYKEWDLCELFN